MQCTWLQHSPVHLNGSYSAAVPPGKWDVPFHFCHGYEPKHHSHRMCTVLNGCISMFRWMVRVDNCSTTCFYQPLATQVNKLSYRIILPTCDHLFLSESMIHNLVCIHVSLKHLHAEVELCKSIAIHFICCFFTFQTHLLQTHFQKHKVYVNSNDKFILFASLWSAK